MRDFKSQSSVTEGLHTSITDEFASNVPDLQLFETETTGTDGGI